MQNSFGMNIASTMIAFVGTAFLSVHLALNTLAFRACRSSQSPDICIFLGSSSNVCFKTVNNVFQIIQNIHVNMNVGFALYYFCNEGHIRFNYLMFNVLIFEDNMVYKYISKYL